MITVKEIAKMCDVSPSTVSNILNGKNNMTAETKEKVLACIEATGYRPNYFAQGMRRQNNKTICIIAEEICQFSTPQIVESIMMYCEKNGYRTIFINLGMYNKWDNKGIKVGSLDLIEENTKPAFLEAQAIRADGVIYVAAHGRALDIVPENYDIPVIFAYGFSKDNKYKSIVIDDEESSKVLVEYLISMGHKKIGVVTGTKENYHTIERLKGFKSALKEHDIKYDPKNVINGDWKRESGYSAAEELLKKDITAIWCMNDVMALGVYDYLIENNIKIGEDISVIGFDDREIASFAYPKLTTSAIMLDDIGILSAKMIIKEIEDPSYRKERVATTRVPCKFIERNSVKKI